MDVIVAVYEDVPLVIPTVTPQNGIPLAMQVSPSRVSDLDMEALAAMAWKDMDDQMKAECPTPQTTQQTFCCYLPDGKVHECHAACPDVYINEERCYVCSVSGFVFGCLSVREDFSTGRQAGSSDPDAHCGEPVGGSWRPRKDMKTLSNQAYETAAQPEAAKAETIEKRKARKQPVKRGARCVDEVQHEEMPKRQKCVRKMSQNRTQFRMLADEAEATVMKLVNFDRRVKPAPTSVSTPSAKTHRTIATEENPTTRNAPQKQADPRLCDPHVIFTAALKKYVKECLANGRQVQLDTVHNLCIQAHNVAKDQQKKLAVAEGRDAILARVNVRQLVAALAVALWTAACATPYMASSRRGADSFRPFVCGLLYALKRGVELPDGTPVVPLLPLLAEALPALRATAARSQAKALHASSHRGLCTLHRCISSCNPDQAAALFSDAARLTTQLTNMVTTKSYRF